jgi:hypothetical protein
VCFANSRVCAGRSGNVPHARKWPPPVIDRLFARRHFLLCFFAYMRGFSSFRAISGNFLSARAARVDNHLGMGLSEFLGHFGATFWDTFWLLSRARFGGVLGRQKGKILVDAQVSFLLRNDRVRGAHVKCQSLSPLPFSNGRRNEGHESHEGDEEGDQHNR